MVNISVANQKGGVGKTVTAFHLSYLFARDNKKILLVDIDPQGNLTSCFTEELEEENNVRLIFEKQNPKPKEVEKNLFLIGSDITLSKYETDSKLENFYKLKNLLENQDFDIVLIDTPPSLGLFTSNAFITSDFVLAPLDISKFSLIGLKDLLETVEKIKVNARTNLKVLGIILCAAQERLNLYKEIKNKLEETYKGLLFRTVIPASVRVKESIGESKPIFGTSPNHKVSNAYKDLYEEIKVRMK